MTLSDAEWVNACRCASQAARSAVAAHAGPAERMAGRGRGAGGDETMAVDLAAEDAVLAELESLDTPVTVISEERGEVEMAGGGPWRVVVDPVDGSVNAGRGLPFSCVSIAVADGPSMPDVRVGWVAELDSPREWWAVRGGGAWCDGTRLPALAPGPMAVLGLETARPDLLADAAPALRDVGARRVRALGSVALSLCLVAAGQMDAMLSLRPVRSVDMAAAQLLVVEAGGAVSFPEAGARPALDLEMRSRAVAARSEELVDRLLTRF